MNTSGSHAAVSWADVHTYGELLSGRGDLFALRSFTLMFALGQSSQSTLVEEAPRQRMCCLFSQRECITAGGASGNENIDVLLTNEANDDFDDDGHEDPNIGKALHDNSHIPFFMNLVGADDVIGGRDLYDGCPTWSDTTLEFAKGMVFKDNDAVIRACNWYHVKKNKHYHVVEINKNVWSTRCSHDCPWKLRACLKKQHGFFEIKQYPEPHICLHGKESLDYRNINSTFITHLIKTQVAEDPGWKIASIIENVKKNSSFTVSYKKAWLGRTKAIAMAFGDWDSSYKNLSKFMRTLELRNPRIAVILENLDLGPMDNVGSPRPIDGTVLTLQAHHRSTWIWEHGGTDALACRHYSSGLYDGELDPRAFGVIPPTEEIDSGRLTMSWLHRTFDVLPKHADDVSVQQHACAYIFQLIGDQVCRQFRLRQVVPVAPNTSPALHVGVIDAAVMRYDDPYMVWYRRITRILVENPAHRPTSRYVEIGSTIEIATRYTAAVTPRSNQDPAT
ncbi:hypothetical protein Acr_14g0006790 [Actinidia rufa]|uniref:Transposase MuDR plant domain-containing protein n=1 Tax=Actinidia rufa TaxID=165716 RepID=A0A7J0FR41_9ERIC|nr:hypothetical protein Acr_14g0006790 [Actinidia rufa]